MLELVIGQKSDAAAVDPLVERLASLPLNGTAYVGYPVLKLTDGLTAVDLLVLCREHGVVAFDLCRGASKLSKEEIVFRQRDRRQALEFALERSGRLSIGGKLIVAPRVVTVDPDRPHIPVASTDVGADTGTVGPSGRSFSGPRFSARRAPHPEQTNQIAVGLSARQGRGATVPDSGVVSGWVDALQHFRTVPPIDAATLRFVDAAVQRMGVVRPVSSGPRLGALSGPRAETLAKIEGQLAHLDEWQKSAAIEMPDGPQRIRGLAGSGKTVVLAFKAAYLHALNPHWRIVLTFYTRTLYEPIRALVTRFYREHTGGTSRRLLKKSRLGSAAEATG